MTTLHRTLQDGLNPLLQNLGSEAGPSKSSNSQLEPRISSVLSLLDLPSIPPAPAPLPKDAPADEVSARKALERVRDRPIDLVRGILEVIGRDIVLGPLISGQPDVSAAEDEKLSFQGELQHRLDVVLTLYEAVTSHYPDRTLNADVQPLEAGGLFVPLLEDLVEVLSIDTWRGLWTYIETRAPRYTKSMLPSRGKALGLLRLFNTLTRFLPRTPEDIAFKGRIWGFASRTIGITDRSAVNFRGEFNTYKTTWEEDGEGDGDVKMDKPKDNEYELYPTLWSLQEYFSYPPLLAAKTKNRRPFDHFEDFKKKTDAVLPKLFEETERERETHAKEKEEGRLGIKRKRTDESRFFHPRYLTDKRLFEHEVKDASFRRQILTQYFILFQFLLNLTSETKAKQAYTGGMPKDFELKDDDSKWIKSKIQAIRGDLLKMPDEGARFDSILLAIIGHEHFYAAWKNEACSETFFEVPKPEEPKFERKVYRLPDQRLQPLHVKYYQPGSKPMPVPVTAYPIDEQGEDDDIDAPEWQRMAKRMRKLKEEMEDDEAMGQLPAEKKTAYQEKIEDMNYRALRLARGVVDAKYFELNTDKTSVLALEDTIRAVESGERSDHVWNIEDEAAEWLTLPEESEPKVEETMDVDGQPVTEELTKEEGADPDAEAEDAGDVLEANEIKEAEEDNHPTEDLADVGGDVKDEEATEKLEGAEGVEGEGTEDQPDEEELPTSQDGDGHEVDEADPAAEEDVGEAAEEAESVIEGTAGEEEGDAEDPSVEETANTLTPVGDAADDEPAVSTPAQDEEMA